MLAVALASGGLAALLALRYLRQQTTPLAAAVPRKANMVVAARAVPMGSVLSEQDLKTIEWSGGALPIGYVGNPADAVGRGVITSLQENEPILEAKLAGKGAGGGLPVIVNEGMRALSMRVNEVAGVSGFVTPNTRVDVLLTLNNDANTNEAATRIIMQDVLTLAAGQTIQPDKDGKPQSVPVVTFLVSPEQAETLALASQSGSIQLALRNSVDTAEVKTQGTRVSALFGGPIGRPAARKSNRPARGAAPVPESAPSQTVVEVYQGGVRTLKRF